MGILKFFGKCIAFVCAIIMILWDILEFITLPAILVVIGIICEMPPAFYRIVIVGYLAIFALFQLLLWLLEKKFGKHFDSLLSNKIGKIARRFEKQ